MCLSIIFGIRTGDGNSEKQKRKVAELADKYAYGLLAGVDKLKPADRDSVANIMKDSSMVFQIHDLPELYCACDIDYDIRNGSKLGTPSKFFDFVREVMETGDIQKIAVLFFEEIKPDDNNVRHHAGDFQDFMGLLNRWHTWQVEGFEPTREAYFIAEETPMLFTFTEIEQVH